jgi:hypothetical protein
MPLTAILVKDTYLHPNRQCCKYQAQHIRSFGRVVFPVRKEAFNFSLRNFIWHMWERTRLRSSMEVVEMLEDLFVRWKQVCQSSCTVVTNRDHVEGI